MMDGQGLRDQVNALEIMLSRQKQEMMGLKGRPDSAGHRTLNARDRLLQNHSKVERDVSAFAGPLNSKPPQHYGEDKWEILTRLAQSCHALNVDCFAFDQTMRFRNGASNARTMQFREARDVCTVADAMIEDFSRKVGKPRTSYILLSESAQFAPEISAIHLSYSNLSIWNLNRTAHEFGHQWAEEYDRSGAQRSFVENVKGTWENPVAKELFADMVAAYMTGLAYGYSCLLLDFNPMNRKSSSTHPSHDERAYCILMVLSEFEKDMADDIRPSLRGLVGELQQYWSEARLAAGAGGPPRTLETLQAEVPITIRRLKQEIPRAQFINGAATFRVKVALKKSLGLPDGADIASVLNGAWLARLDTSGEEFRDLGPAILRMLLDAGDAIEQAG